jgi:hypothetical protein
MLTSPLTIGTETYDNALLDLTLELSRFGHNRLFASEQCTLSASHDRKTGAASAMQSHVAFVPAALGATLLLPPRDNLCAHGARAVVALRARTSLPAKTNQRRFRIAPQCALDGSIAHAHVDAEDISFADAIVLPVTDVSSPPMTAIHKVWRIRVFLAMLVRFHVRVLCVHEAQAIAFSVFSFHILPVVLVLSDTASVCASCLYLEPRFHTQSSTSGGIHSCSARR